MLLQVIAIRAIRMMNVVNVPESSIKKEGWHQLIDELERVCAGGKELS